MNYEGLTSTYVFREAKEEGLRFPDGRKRQTNITRPGRQHEFPDGKKGFLCFASFCQGRKRVPADMVVDVVDPETGETINQIDCSRAEFEKLPKPGDPKKRDAAPVDDVADRKEKREAARADQADKEAKARGPAPQDPPPAPQLSETYNAPQDGPPAPRDPPAGQGGPKGDAPPADPPAGQGGPKGETPKGDAAAQDKGKEKSKQKQK